jgi:hypothetical protein
MNVASVRAVLSHEFGWVLASLGNDMHSGNAVCFLCDSEISKLESVIPVKKGFKGNSYCVVGQKAVPGRFLPAGAALLL